MKEVKETSMEVEGKLKEVIENHIRFTDLCETCIYTTRGTEERNQELAEENDKKSQACNVILHCVNESESTGAENM